MLALLVLLLQGCASPFPASRDNWQSREAGQGDNPAAANGQAVSFSAPLSLQEAIALALRSNPRQAQALASIRQARAAVQQATSGFWPRLSLFTEYLQGDAPSAYLFKTIDARKLPPGVNFNDPGWFENFESGLQAQWNLYNGGRTLLRRQMAVADLAVSRLDRQQLQNQLTAAVIATYYSALAAEQIIRIAEQSVQTVNKQLELVRVRYEGGSVLKSDLLSMQVRLAQAREDLVKAQNSHQQLIAGLATLLGLEAGTELELTEAEPLGIEVPASLEAALAYGLRHRPELAKAREQITKSRMGLSLARTGYWPRLDLQSKYYYDDPNLHYADDRENWTVGLVFNWEVFSGFETPARVHEAEAVLQQMLAVDREKVLQVQLDIKNGLLALAAAEARLRVTRESARQAEESLRLVQLEYEGGSATITRYLNAELASNQSKVNVVQARYDREKALAELARAMGFWRRGLAAAEGSGPESAQREMENGQSAGESSL